MSMCAVYLAGRPVCHMCAWSHVTGVTDGCELLWGCWESNPGFLQDQPVLLTPEPFLHPVFFSLLKKNFLNNFQYI